MVIQLLDVGRAYPGTWALRGVSTTLPPGQIYGLLGANGAGKSTLLALLAGWVPLSTGRILLDESPMRPTAVHLRRRVFLLDDWTGRPRRDARPMLEVARLIDDYNADRPGIEDEVAAWFARLGVASVYRSVAGQISKGQVYKIAMVALLVIAPEVWLLDEPFSAGLDAEGLQILEREIRAHAARGGTVIFTSQWPEHARRLADWVLVLDEGHLVWNAPSRQVPTTDLTENAAPRLSAVLQGLGNR